MKIKKGENKVKKNLIISMIITVVTAIICTWFIMTTDGDIPTNWGVDGEVTDYGSPMYLITFPIVSLVVVLLTYFTPRIDPKGENIKNSGPMLGIIMVLIPVLMLGILVFIIAAVNNASIFNLIYFISVFIALLLIVIGYYSPRVKPNYMMGIRTPWTLHSEKVWVKTHQVSRNWFMGVGLSFLVFMFIKAPYNIIIPSIILMAVAIGLTVYSYILYVSEKK